MTFTPKTFTNGDTLPAASLNDMDNNDDHVREEAAYRNLWFIARAEYTDPVGPVDLQLYVDTTAMGTPLTGSGSQADIALSGVSVGLHTLSVRDDTEVIATTRFYRSADLNFLTWWITQGTVDAATDYIANMTVLGHREAKSWT